MVVAGALWSAPSIFFPRRARKDTVEEIGGKRRARMPSHSSPRALPCEPAPVSDGIFENHRVTVGLADPRRIELLNKSVSTIRTSRRGDRARGRPTWSWRKQRWPMGPVQTAGVGQVYRSYIEVKSELIEGGYSASRSSRKSTRGGQPSSGGDGPYRAPHTKLSALRNTRRSVHIASYMLHRKGGAVVRLPD